MLKIAFLWSVFLGTAASLHLAVGGCGGRRPAFACHTLQCGPQHTRSVPVFAESTPLTLSQVEQLEREHVGFEAEEAKPPKCPVQPQHLSNRVVKAIVDHDMEMLMKRSLDPTGRPQHLHQVWKIKKHRKRLNPVLFRVGEKVKGRVAITFPTYALVDVGSTSYGVLHARDMSEGWIDRVDHSITSGEDLIVTVKSIDEDARFIRLTLLDLPKLEGPTGEPIERRPLHTFRVEEAVAGVIRRRSPLGYYVDVGATVDGFLHINDRKLPRKYTGIARQPFRIGTRIPTLYVKCVDLVKNRLQLSENSLAEELEKRCLTGQETPEQQAVYHPGNRLSMLQSLQANDLEKMRMIGGYDDLLKEVGADRNASTAYVMYLQNRKKIEHLEHLKDTVLDDADNMDDVQLRRATKEYNRLSAEIAELKQEANEPPPFRRTVYKYGDPGVWESRVYTPFDEKNPRDYFQKVTEEVTTALRDVQGENFDFKGAMADDLHSAERRGEIVEHLWDIFHAPPSDKSKIEDTEPRYATLEDIDDLLPESEISNEAHSSWADVPDADTVVAKLETYDHPEAKDLAEMIRSASGFNPFAHSDRLIDDDKTAILGASAMANDDVTTWQARLDRMYEDVGVDPMDVAAATLAGKSHGKRTNGDSSEEHDILMQSFARDDGAISEVPNVDEYVDSTEGAKSEVNFLAPEVEDDDDTDYVETSELSDDDFNSDDTAESSKPGGYNEGPEDAEHRSRYTEKNQNGYDIDVSDVYDSVSDSDDDGSDFYSGLEDSDDASGVEDSDADEEESDTDDTSDIEDFKDVASSIFASEELTELPKTRSKSRLGQSHSLRDVASEVPTSGTLTTTPTTDTAIDVSTALPKGPLEPVEKCYEAPTITDDIQNIFNEVRALTANVSNEDTPLEATDFPPKFENRDTRKINHQLYIQRNRFLDPVTRLYVMSKVPPRPLPPKPEDELESDSDGYDFSSTVDRRPKDGFMRSSDSGTNDDIDARRHVGQQDEFRDIDYFDFSSDDTDDEGEEHVQSPEELKKVRSLVRSVVNSDQRRRTLSRIARKALPPEVVAKCKQRPKEPEHMEEMARLLRFGRKRPKLTPYTYFPEGIGNAGLGEDRRSMNRRIRDANLKLTKLKRNKRFLSMLHRLDVDPDELTFDNIHQMLPFELVSSRPPPFRKLMGIGESNLPDEKG
ncbi:RNA-binding S1 domain-containing protein [Babesia ovata]|uniref:RNA-binding S1 domain-containing protein n=1 Tax=Babesia ovata TaxID=189622 RepID=A0A2H6K6C2_9APIC|nr:RNA-binding S1 domain-containing protein [Babesia ovata]GBE58536.1 RNA-binding S1 domain-containing protein [Babesia ovata]